MYKGSKDYPTFTILYGKLQVVEFKCSLAVRTAGEVMQLLLKHIQKNSKYVEFVNGMYLL